MPDEVTVEEAPEVEATDDHAEQNVTVVVSDAQAPEPASEHCEHCEEHAARIQALEAALVAWETELQEVEAEVEAEAPAEAEYAETETVIGEQAVEAPVASTPEEPPAVAAERHAGFWM